MLKALSSTEQQSAQLTQQQEARCWQKDSLSSEKDAPLPKRSLFVVLQEQTAIYQALPTDIKCEELLVPQFEGAYQERPRDFQTFMKFCEGLFEGCQVRHAFSSTGRPLFALSEIALKEPFIFVSPSALFLGYKYPKGVIKHHIQLKKQRSKPVDFNLTSKSQLRKHHHC